jgi:cell division septation protein DedD
MRRPIVHLAAALIALGSLAAIAPLSAEEFDDAPEFAESDAGPGGAVKRPRRRGVEQPPPALREPERPAPVATVEEPEPTPEPRPRPRRRPVLPEHEQAELHGWSLGYAGAMRSLRAKGFTDIEGLRRRGWVYVAEAITEDGDLARVVINARTGDVEGLRILRPHRAWRHGRPRYVVIPQW